MIETSFRKLNFTETVKQLNDETNREGEKWFREGRKVHLMFVFWNMLTRFIRMYFLNGRWRGGYVGFMEAFNASLYHLLSYTKYWELNERERGRM